MSDGAEGISGWVPARLGDVRPRSTRARLGGDHFGGVGDHAHVEPVGVTELPRGAAEDAEFGWIYHCEPQRAATTASKPPDQRLKTEATIAALPLETKVATTPPICARPR